MEEQGIKRLMNELFGNRDSVFGVVDGFNQTGKTDFVLSVTDWAYQYGYFKGFGLNQQVENAPYEYDYITDLQTLMDRVTTFKGKYLFFFDELGKSAPRAVPWSKLTLELIQKFEIKRKDLLSVIGCSIGDIDRRIISPNYLDWHITKLGLTTARLQHLQKRYSAILTQIPPTRIKFEEFIPAQFSLEPVNETRQILDHDVNLALAWANKVKYQGELSKQGRFNAIRRGVLKLSKLIGQDVNATMLEEPPAGNVDK